MCVNKLNLFLLLFICSSSFLLAQNPLFEERDGIVVVEAEHFVGQSVDSIRKWYKLDEEVKAGPTPDIDPSHASSASGKAYLEILPDTRTNHSEKLIPGENFTNSPGKLALLHYLVYFNNPGKYYVWVRAYSTGSEDNGIHVGLDGEWPESGQRMQWCQGKNQWTWESKQRTAEQHCGVPEQIYLDIPSAGWHEITFSMREDGFEFDKWILSKEYKLPEGAGPAETLRKF
ncbi:MAG: hypothetical protein F6K19_43555 [Cyanothece sp. SIO1E1]|nr:hypothetical protein [Cyanothece sp. SIO1E1]